VEFITKGLTNPDGVYFLSIKSKSQKIEIRRW